MSSFGAAFYGAYAQGEAAKDATAQRAAQAREYNAAQERLFHLTRGSEGSAFLPEYLRGAESAAGARAADTAAALRRYYGSAEDVARRGAAVADRYRPLLDEGSKAISGIFSGELERKRLESAEPTFAARTALADTTRSGIMRGVLQRLNAIRTANAAKGYVGDSSASQNLGFKAAIEGNQAAGSATAAAELQNAMERQAIRDEILNLQLRSPELAGALAAQAANFETLPGQIAGQISRSETSPLDYFRIGTAPPPSQTMAPWAQEQLSPWASVAAAGQGNLSAVGRLFANRDLARRYGAAGGGGGGGGGGGYYGGYPGDVGYYNYSGGYQPYDQYYDSIDYGGDWGGGGGGGAGLGTAAGDAAFAGEDLGY